MWTSHACSPLHAKLHSDELCALVVMAMKARVTVVNNRMCAGCFRMKARHDTCAAAEHGVPVVVCQEADEDLTEAQQAAIMKAGRERARRERLNDR